MIVCTRPRSDGGLSCAELVGERREIRSRPRSYGSRKRVSRVSIQPRTPVSRSTTVRSSSSADCAISLVAALRLGRGVERAHGHEQRREHARDDERDQGEGRAARAHAGCADGRGEETGGTSQYHPSAGSRQNRRRSADRLVSDRTRGIPFHEDPDRRRRAWHAPARSRRRCSSWATACSRPRTAARAGRPSQLHRPDVVITDWAMPGMDGTELTARIRAAEGAYTYIMVLSARADEQASREAVQAGADDVLAKPPDPNEIERGLIAAERLTAMHRRLSRRRAAGRADRRGLALAARRGPRGGVRPREALRARLLPGDDRARAGRRRERSRACGVALGAGDPLRATSSTAPGARSSSCCCPSRGWRPPTSPPTGCGTRPSTLPRGAQVSVGMVTTGTEPEPEALLASAEAALTRASESGGIVGRGRRGDRRAAAAASPTTILCRG